MQLYQNNEMDDNYNDGNIVYDADEDDIEEIGYDYNKNISL